VATNWCEVHAHAALEYISLEGCDLPSDFLNGIIAENKGVILVEGRKVSQKPLVLEIRKRSDNTILFKNEMLLTLSGVEEMFRFTNMLASAGGSGGYPSRMTEPRNNPDSLSSGKSLIYVHGYNNNPAEARERMCEMFKRAYWSGSHAKFYAINWRGDQSEILGYSCNFHVNVEHAFQTATDFAGFVRNNVGGDVTVWAHSLGNVLTGSAICGPGNAPVTKWVMINAAMPIEALDANAYTTNMVNPSWDEYDSRLRISDWPQLFQGSGDARASLSWKGLFSSTGMSRVYNFYSSGEDVLGNIPHSTCANVVSYPWGCQEKLKGRMWSGLGWFVGSVYCGWGFTSNHLYGEEDSEGNWHQWDSETANRHVSTMDLKAAPFFRDGPSPNLFANDQTGSQYAEANRHLLLARAIPATSVAAGANAVEALPASHNRNMQHREKDGNVVDEGLQNGWPRSDTIWRHGDYKDVAYVYTYKLFDAIVALEKAP